MIIIMVFFGRGIPQFAIMDVLDALSSQPRLILGATNPNAKSHAANVGKINDPVSKKVS